VPAAGIRPLRAGDAEREGKPAARRQALDPAVRRPRNGEIHVDAVGRDFGPAGAVAMDNADIAAAGKEGLGPLGQRGVELDRRDFAARADQLGQDRAIVAGAGADMDDALARLRAQGLDELGVQRRAGC
jgi:hypothetical protein